MSKIVEVKTKGFIYLRKPQTLKLKKDRKRVKMKRKRNTKRGENKKRQKKANSLLVHFFNFELSFFNFFSVKEMMI